MILTQKQFFRRIKVKNDLLPILLSIIIMIDNSENKKQAEFLKSTAKKYLIWPICHMRLQRLF